MNLTVAALKKRWQTRAALAVTVESGRIAVNLVRRENGGSRVVQSFVLPLGADALVADPQKTGEELAAHLRASAIRERRCVVCIPAGWAITTATDVPGISPEDLRGYLELRAESEFPVPVADLRLAHCVYLLPDGKQRATVVAVPAKRIEAVERMLDIAGCRAVSISLGLDGCMPESDGSAGLHFLANGTHVDLVIAAGGGIAALRSLSGPAKMGTPPFDANAFSREVRITLGGLPETVRQQIREANFSGSPSAETLRTQISPQLSRMGIVTVPPPARGAAGHSGAALEAVQHHLREEPIVFEFVPPQVSRWQTVFQRFDSRRRRWILLAAIALLVLPVTAFLIRSSTESHLEGEWNAMRKNVGELENLQLKLRQFRQWFDPAPQTVQALEALAAAFPDQGDVWAKSIQLGEGSKVTCSGFARNQAGFDALRDRLRSRSDVTGLQVQQVRGDNPVQFSLTYKWEPHDAK